MFPIYQDIFKKRGHLYHQAMMTYPTARTGEFQHILRMADVKAGDVLCDIPSGGGYLRHFLDRTVTLIHIETSEVFAELCRANGAEHVLLGTLENIPVETGSVDKVISLAALHHLDDKNQFFIEACRMLKNGGTISIADVQKGSAVSKFLDDFVDRHSTMGHLGQYMHGKTFEDLARAGFVKVKSSLIPFHWEFDSPEVMGSFCRLLFGIDKAGPEHVVEGIQQHLGYSIDHNVCRMNWELLFFHAEKL